MQLHSGVSHEWPGSMGALAGSCLWGSAMIVGLLIAGCASAPPPSGPVHPPLSADMSSDMAIHAVGLVGTPYRWGGNTPDSGFDCSGLIGYVYKGRTGSAPPRTVAQLAAWGQPVPARDLRSGDLVIFGANPPTHAGIYVGVGRFVHAPSRGGTVRMDRLDNRYWSSQPTRFRRP